MSETDDRPKAASLLEPEELARLAERARLDVHSGVKGLPRSDDELADDAADALRSREHALFVRGLTGLRFAARAYAARRDPAGLTPIVWGAWALTAGQYDAPWTFAADGAALAIASAGERVLEVPGLAERLARSPLAAVRAALARALPASARSILLALAADDDPNVRAAASAKAGAVDEWGGVFSISPEGHARELLEAARVVLEERVRDLAADPSRAEGAFAPLSDALAVACWSRVLRSEEVVDDAWRPWLARLVERSGGGAALVELVELWHRRGWLIGDARLADVKALDPAVRARAVSEMMARIRAVDTGMGGPGSDVAQALASIAPEDGDSRGLLEVILGAPIEQAHEALGEDGVDLVASELSRVLARWPLEPSVRDALWNERREGMRGRWRRVGPEVWSVLGPDSVLRERAWADLGSGDRSRYGAAVRAILSEHLDPEGEPADALAERLYERPELRWNVLVCSRAVLPRAQRDLEAGELDLSTAVRVLQMTPPEAQTDAMWSAARALRDEALAGDQRALVLHACRTLVRPGDAWDPSDLAYAREVIEHALASDEAPYLLHHLVEGAKRIDAPETDALFSDIEVRASGEHARYFRHAMEDDA